MEKLTKGELDRETEQSTHAIPTMNLMAIRQELAKTMGSGPELLPPASELFALILLAQPTDKLASPLVWLWDQEQHTPVAVATSLLERSREHVRQMATGQEGHLFVVSSGVVD